MLNRDFLYGLRSFARRPGFISVVVFILALGIAFLTMVATLAHSIYLGQVPYDDPDSLVVLWRQGPEPFHDREATSYLNILDWAAGGEAFFDGLAAYTIYPSSIQRPEGAVRVTVTFVDPYFFDALDIDMSVGRPLMEADNAPPSGDPVVVLSYGFWQSVYGGDTGIEGRSINLGGHSHTVVGIMSPEARWLQREPFEVVVPYRRSAIGMSPAIVEDRGAHSSIVVGRLKEGVTVEQAQVGMNTVAMALQEQYPDVNTGINIYITPFAEVRGDFGRLNSVVTVLGVAAGLVFLLSCISVTLLVLIRFVERSREFAMRRALGAESRRFFYQALAEGLSITLVAGAVGFGLAWATTKLVFVGNPLRMYSFTEVTIHSSVFVLSILLALATTLLFGMVPVLRSTGIDFHAALRPAGVGEGSGKHGMLRRGLVVMQVAVSVAVLVGGGLVLRSLYMFTQTDYGFDTSNLVYMRLLLDGPRYDEDGQRLFYRDLEQRLAALPDVEHAALWGPDLPGSSHHFTLLVPEGREWDPTFDGLHTWYHFVTPGATERIGLRLVEGRMLDNTDQADSLSTVVVSQDIANTFWPGDSAVGKRIVDPDGDGWRTVVGVVSDSFMRGLGRSHSEMRRDIYITLDQVPTEQTNIFLRTSGDTAATARMARETVRDIDPTLAVFDVSTMDASMAQDRREMIFITTLMMLFAGAASILTTVGIYSVMSYATSRRTREIGVRVALGARNFQVIGLVLRNAAIDMALGIAIGVAGALAAGNIISNLLYEVAPTDPVAFFLIVPALLVIALVATFIPVRRALSVDPCEALRHE